VYQRIVSVHGNVEAFLSSFAFLASFLLKPDCYYRLFTDLGAFSYTSFSEMSPCFVVMCGARSRFEALDFACGVAGIASPLFCETAGRLSVASCRRFVNYSGAFAGR
jgi:hypothetical protein